MIRKAAYLAVVPFLAALASSPASAADLPSIRIADKNQVPQCATPGRLMAYLKSRNGDLDKRFDAIATEYMRNGEALGLRWDYAFFQMIAETGTLSFKNGNRQGDVRPDQNNFAGLGATGKGERGESFPDVATGAKAHLQHLMLYAGAPVESAVAERTRKVQEWGVLTSWQKGFNRPITFADLAKKWAPGAGGYASTIQSIADKFYDETCKQADPRPELVAEARGQKVAAAKSAEARPAESKPTGTDLARKAIVDGKVEGNDKKSGVGAATIGSGIKILNAPAAEAEPVETPKFADKLADQKSAEKATVQTVAAAAGAAKALAAPAAAASQKCRVWTASYGGQKAIIVRSVIDQVLNFTVLDVNEGQETREADAFISAYAKGGTVEGRFGTQAQALDKAFDLCPEG